MKQKNCAFRKQAIDDSGSGSFSGWAATYNNTDLGGDVILPGAFTRTLQSNGGNVPLLWQHDSSLPVGTAAVTDSSYGLMVNGQLELSVPQANVAYQLLKKNVIRGLSIGYDVVKASMGPDGQRVLSELKLWEVSVATFPMNEQAMVTGVKAVTLDDVLPLLQSISDIADPDTVAALTKINAQLRTLLHDPKQCNDPDCVDPGCVASRTSAKSRDEELLALRTLAANVKWYVRR